MTNHKCAQYALYVWRTSNAVWKRFMGESLRSRISKSAAAFKGTP